MEANELVNADGRQSESPARTIDSLGSTLGSMDTIVDRNEELMQITVDNSTNTTNLDNHDKNSLTNSQISIIAQDEKANGLLHQQDAQSHIYSSPVYMTAPVKPNEVVPQTEVPKLITHAEFEKQKMTVPPPKLAELAKSSTATLDSKISKKQRFPAELIMINGDSTKDLKAVGRRSSFPDQVTLGVVQLLLSIALVALGALLVVREASLAMVGSGIWTGGIAAITGALGVINMRKVQTGFLALSLVCIATSTLALAISGVGLTRDITKLDEEFNLKFSNEKIAAAYWLILTLGLHFIASVTSVYKLASRLCSRPIHDESTMYDNINNSVDHDKIEEYIKAMSMSSGTNNLMKKEQLAPQLIYSSMKHGSVKDSLGSRSIILIPASMGNALLPGQQPLTQMMRPPLGVSPPYPMLLPPGVTLPPLPPLVYRGGMTLPYKRPTRYSHGSHRSQMASIRHHRHRHPHPLPGAVEINGRHSKSHRRTCTNDGGRRQRRKSDTDADNRKAFTYTGLDRQIADSFLARQEQTNGSHIDYTSSGESGRNECHDVAM